MESSPSIHGGAITPGLRPVTAHTAPIKTRPPGPRTFSANKRLTSDLTTETRVNNSYNVGRILLFTTKPFQQKAVPHVRTAIKNPKRLSA